MKTQQTGHRRATGPLLALCLLLPLAASAQVPVDEDGNEFTTYSTDPDTAATGNEDIPLLSTVDLEELVGPIALYPDDLLAVILPASAYPLQIVDAARFLEALDDDPTLEPDPAWDDSVVALLNYPEVIEFLNDDIDWTWRLGEAVVAQQADVVAAIEGFRDRAYAAGNLKSDEHQKVTRDNGVIEITPASDDVIYVPYYEPERVVVYQPRPVYYYYPRAYPVYYYPYASAYRFHHNWFWGVTTAFRIGWFSDSLHVLHHSYYGHPYFGRQYYDRWWYRRPSISAHNVIYVGGNSTTTVNRYYGGDRWRPRHDRREYLEDRHYPRHRHDRSTPSRQHDRDRPRRITRQTDPADTRRPAGSVQRRERLDRDDADSVRQRTRADREPITFRRRVDSQNTNRRTSIGENADRRRPEVAIRRDDDRRWQASGRSEGQARTESRRQNRAVRSEQRSTTKRQATPTNSKRPVAERRRSEPAPKIARLAPAARSERRVDSTAHRQVRRSAPTIRKTHSQALAPARVEPRANSTQRPQVRRSEPRARSAPKQSSAAARTERATRRAQQRETGVPSRKAGRYAARAERRR